MALTNKQPTAKIAVRASVKIGSTEYDVLHFDPSVTESVDTIEVKAVGAAKTLYFPGALTNSATLEVKILKGATTPTVGETVDLEISVIESTNGGEPSAATTKTIKCFIQQIAEDRIEGDGASRLEAYTLTLQPTGESAE